MPQFNNLAELMQYVGNVTMDEIANDVENINEETLLQELRETVYANPSGAYENTYSLLNAVNTRNVTIGAGKEVDIEIETYIEPKLLDYEYPSYDFTIENGTGNLDNRNWIVSWLENGQNGITPYAGHHFFAKGQLKLNKDTKKRLQLKLKKNGYKIGYASRSLSE